MKKIDLPSITLIAGFIMMLLAGFIIPQSRLDKYEILLFVVLPYLSFYAWHVVIKHEIRKGKQHQVDSDRELEA